MLKQIVLLNPQMDDQVEPLVSQRETSWHQCFDTAAAATMDTETKCSFWKADEGGVRSGTGFAKYHNTVKQNSDSRPQWEPRFSTFYLCFFFIHCGYNKQLHYNKVDLIYPFSIHNVSM